jgi:hypothetical protein
MPFTVNGFGTTMCPARGLISWHPGSWWSRHGTHDYDGVACLCAFFLPLVPYSTVHVFNRSAQGMGEQYQQIPIRWSPGLVFAAFARRWLLAIAIAGVIVMFVAWSDPSFHRDTVNSMMRMSVGAGLVVFAVLIGWGVMLLDRRNHDLRRVMLGTPFGSSDPVTWTSAYLANVQTPDGIFGAPTFAEAAENALEAGEFGRAMLAARYCAAIEDAKEGESLTDEILSHPEVADALPLVHKDPNQWRTYFGKGTSSAETAAVTSPALTTQPDDRIQTDPREVT